MCSDPASAPSTLQLPPLRLWPPHCPRHSRGEPSCARPGACGRARPWLLCSPRPSTDRWLWPLRPTGLESSHFAPEFHPFLTRHSEVLQRQPPTQADGPKHVRAQSSWGPRTRVGMTGARRRLPGARGRRARRLGGARPRGRSCPPAPQTPRCPARAPGPAAELSSTPISSWLTQG